MVKAVFFDIDGTLVSFSTHRISDNTLKALYELKEKDVRLYIASGRHRLLMNNLSGFPFDGYISMNGSLIYDGEEVIYRKPLEHCDAVRIAEIAQNNSIPCALFGETVIGMNCQSDLTRQVFRMIDLPEPENVCLTDFAGTPVYQYTIFVNREAEEKYLAPAMKHSCSTRWHPEFTDIIPSGLSKAEGIMRILAGHGISADEVMAFGDGGNDVEMLSFAGTGVAMGNALPEVREHSDFVTKSVDEDGIVFALRHFSLL